MYQTNHIRQVKRVLQSDHSELHCCALLIKGYMGFISKLFGKTKSQPMTGAPLQSSKLAEFVAIEEKKYRSVFNNDGLGTMEIASGHSELIPWCLIQEIDIGFKDPSTTHRVRYYVTAEFHYDELELDLSQSEAFFEVMSEQLDDFDHEAAKIAVQKLIEDKIGATIYMSSAYPDAEIFPKV